MSIEDILRAEEEKAARDARGAACGAGDAELFTKKVGLCVCAVRVRQGRADMMAASLLLVREEGPITSATAAATTHHTLSHTTTHPQS